MFATRSISAFCLIASVAICAAAPLPARSEPALYTASIGLRVWDRNIPYGASQNAPKLGNSPAGDVVSLIGSGPAQFALPAGQLALTTSVWDASPPYTTLVFRRTSFAGANEAGNFFGGAAPGPAQFAPLPSLPGSQFGVSLSGEPARFGGVMRLLGDFNWHGQLANCSPPCAFGTRIPLTPIGGPVGGTATAMTYLGGSIYPPTLVTATAWGFPWQTGTVTGVAAVDGTSSHTTTSAKAADSRGLSGLGTLQLVTPFLVRVRSHPPFCGGCENQWFYAGTASAEFRFVPEPSVIAGLATGAVALVILARNSRRRAL